MKIIYHNSIEVSLQEIIIQRMVIIYRFPYIKEAIWNSSEGYTFPASHSAPVTKSKLTCTVTILIQHKHTFCTTNRGDKKKEQENIVSNIVLINP